MSDEGKFVRRMDTWLRNNIDNEEIFVDWLYVVPDEITDEDCEDIGNDPDELAIVTKLFARIVMDDK